jgi:flagellar protein FliJ
MSVRENLLRLHRWRLQERRDYLAGLESLMERLRADVARLQEEIGESEAVNGHAADGGDPPPYLVPLIERRAKIERSMAEIEAQIAEARDVVEAAQQEVKHAGNGAGTNALSGPMRVSRRVRRERQPRSRAESPFAGNTRLF